jgi:branched-chain amino acid transport system substrate-binding protein
MPHPQRAKGLFWRLGIALPLLAVAVSGCKQPSGTTSGTAGGAAGAGGTDAAATANVGKAAPYQGDEIKLGHYASLTGNTATFGNSADKGMQMAIAEANTAGGVLGKKIRLVTADTASKTEQASSAVLRLINQDKVLAVLGEVASSRSLAAAPICQKAGVPMLSPASTNPDVTKAGDYVFRACFIDPFQGTVVARFAQDKLSAKTAAILSDVSQDYSKGLAKYFKDEFSKTGKIVAEASYSSETDKDFRAQLTTIKGANPDVIFIPGYYTEVGNIAVQAQSLGIKKPMLGGDGWESPKLVEIGKGAIEGQYYSTHYSPEDKNPRVQKFVTDFKKRFNETPEGMAALGYDSARMMIAAINTAGDTDRDKIRDALAATKDFAGVTGNITIDENRNAVKSAVMLQIKNRKPVYVSTVKP